MSHEVETMFYTHKKPWWLGSSVQGEAIGTFVGEHATDSERAIIAAGMDWSVFKARSAWGRDKVPSEAVHLDPNPTIWTPVDGQFFIVRDKDYQVLGRCANKWVPFQNRDAFKFLDSLAASGEMRYHTAGSLTMGQKVWILAQLPGSFKIGRLSGTTSVHHPFLLIIVAHDGITGINMMPTEITAECANTCGFAEYRAQSEKLFWSVSHDSKTEAKLKIAVAALTEIPAAMAAREVLLQELAERPMTTEQFIDFATSIFLDIDCTEAEKVEALTAKWYEEATVRSKTILENKVATVTKLFQDGIAAEGNSAYDAVMAFTQHFDHAEIQSQIKDKIRRAQNIVNSSWLGAGAQRKALVLKRLAG